MENLKAALADRYTLERELGRGGRRPRLEVRFDDPGRPRHRYGFGVHHNRYYFTLGDQQSDIWMAEVDGSR